MFTSFHYELFSDPVTYFVLDFSDSREYFDSRISTGF